jgi:hypothetical protein
MLAHLRRSTTLILVGAAALAAGGSQPAAPPEGAAAAPTTGLASVADTWLGELLLGWTPGWVQGWLDSETEPRRDPQGPEPQTDDAVNGRGGEEPSVGGVDDPAGPWA